VTFIHVTDPKKDAVVLGQFMCARL